MNPEDADEIVYAVLTHVDADETPEDADWAVRCQIAGYKLAQKRFQLEAYQKLTPQQSAVRAIIDLLVEKDYGTIHLATRPAAPVPLDLGGAITEYGRTLVKPDAGWWSVVTLTEISAPAGGGLHVAAPLWTAEEGRSDLTLELRLLPGPKGRLLIEVNDLHVR
jgi:hypothetical protein